MTIASRGTVSGGHDTTAPPRHVLIIDDDVSVADTFARLLRLEGYDVLTASSAEAGLQALDNVVPDAILVDLQMPLVDGLGFLVRLRARERHRYTPVAIVTGHYFLEDSVAYELRALGAELHFKPLWTEDLIAVARGLLDRRDRRVFG